MGRFIVLHIPHIVPGARGVRVPRAARARRRRPAARAPRRDRGRRLAHGACRSRTRTPRAPLDLAHRADRARSAARGDRPRGSSSTPSRSTTGGRRPPSAGPTRSSRRSPCCSSCWKLVDAGGTRLRRGLDLHRALTEGASLLLAALGVPLIVTGAWLLARPSDGSFAANVHLVASVWWVALFGAHLLRYLGRSVDAALRGKSSD